jgi:hypothetical protein
LKNEQFSDYLFTTGGEFRQQNGIIELIIHKPIQENTKPIIAIALVSNIKAETNFCLNLGNPHKAHTKDYKIIKIQKKKKTCTQIQSTHSTKFPQTQVSLNDVFSWNNHLRSRNLTNLIIIQYGLLFPTNEVLGSRHITALLLLSSELQRLSVLLSNSGFQELLVSLSNLQFQGVSVFRFKISSSELKAVLVFLQSYQGRVPYTLDRVHFHVKIDYQLSGTPV